MAESPNANVQDMLLTVAIKVNNAPMQDTVSIESIQITHAINRISYAEVLLIAPDSIESSDFATIESATFNPGTKIEISAGYAGASSSTIFSGIITKFGIDLDNSAIPKIRIICKHAAVALTFNRTEAMFANQTDSAIIQSILGAYSTLSTSVDSTSPTLEYVFQKASTDWDFILARAHFNGLLITMDGDSFKVSKPSFSASPALKISLIDTVYQFEAALNAEKQIPSLQTNAWDAKNQNLLNASAAEPSLNTQGNLSAKTLGSALGQTALNYTSLTPMQKEDLQAWADGLLLKNRMAALKGKITFTGNALAKTGSLIELDGVSAKFNGNAFVSEVSHTISNNIWKTTAKFGWEDKAVYEHTDFSYPAATGQLPGISGLQIATVTKLSADPQSMFRVQVSIPSTASSATNVWARYAHFYATNGAGAFFMPEVGDEVVIGFVDADPRYPVILGSLYSSNHASPVRASDENNYTKSLTTKTKMVLGFDEEKKIITLKTPGGNSIVISDDGKSITLTDQNSNSIKMSSDGITLNSAKDINLTASGGIKLSATNAVTISAQSDVSIKGMNVTAEAQMGFTGKGSATAEVSASGQTTLKGGIVMIN